MKKLLSMLLCLALLAAVLVVPAMAEDDTYREPITLTVFSGLANSAGEQGGWFAKEIKDRFNITLNFVSTNVDSNAWTSAVSAGSIGMLQSRKGMFFVPYGQDDAEGKPCSCVADFEKILPAAQAALEGRQLQPLII